MRSSPSRRGVDLCLGWKEMRNTHVCLCVCVYAKSGSSFKRSDCSVTNESLLHTSASCYAPVWARGGVLVKNQSHSDKSPLYCAHFGQ